MSGGIPKPRSVKSQQRDRLYASIHEFGVEVMPCSFCYRKGWKCHMMPGVSRCKECVRRGRSCDGSGVPTSSLNRIISESQRLRQQEKDTEESLSGLQRELSSLQSRLQESLGRLQRIRAQRESLTTRGAEMVNRGLASLDELETHEREESNAVVSAQADGAVDVIDWNAIGIDLDASLPSSVLAGLDFGDENPQQVQNNPSGAS